MEFNAELDENDDDVINPDGSELIVSSNFIALIYDYRHILTKLIEMAFILGVDYEYILSERDQKRSKLEFVEAQHFVNSVSYELEKKVAIGDHMIIEAIQNWDNLGAHNVVSGIDHWISDYIQDCSDQSRVKDVENFICKQEISWLRGLADHHYC